MRVYREFSDVACLERLRANDARAFDELFDLYAPGLGRFALNCLKSKADAEEVVQDSFLKIWERRHDFDDGIVFKLYLYKCAYHAVLKQVRYQKSWVFEDCHRELIITDDVPSKQVEYSELEGLHQLALAKLPPKRRQIFMLSRQEGISYASIAKEMNISVKNVEAQMTCALKFLRAYFRAHGITLAFALLVLQNG